MFGVGFEVLIVCSDDAKCFLAVEAMEDALRQRATDLWLGAAAELVDEQQAPLAAMANHLLHMKKVGGVGRKVIVNALLVANVNEHLRENARRRSLRGRNGHAALHHVLQEGNRLQTDGLAAGVRSGNEQDATSGRKRNVQRFHLLALAFQTSRKKGMVGALPVQTRGIHGTKNDGADAAGVAGERTEIVNVSEKDKGMLNVGQHRANEVGEFAQDANDLAMFLGFEFTHPIVGIDYRSGLDEDRAPRGTFIVNNAFDLALGGRGNGNDETTVTHGGRNVAVNVAVLLRLRNDGAKHAGEPAHRLLEFPTQAGEFGRSGVFHLTIFVQNGIDASDDGGESLHVVRHAFQRRILIRNILFSNIFPIIC